MNMYFQLDILCSKSEAPNEVSLALRFTQMHIVRVRLCIPFFDAGVT